MSGITSGILLCVLLFVGILLCALLGEYAGRNSRHDNPPTNATTGAVLGLLGLLLAFSYSGAFERYNRRREVMVAEANAVATVHQRIDLLPADVRPRIRRHLRD